MASASTTDWVLAERRKQNAVVIFVVLACLAAALFPRNERRLFAFPDEGGLMATISAPFQTSLRSGIFDGPAVASNDKADREPSQVVREEMVLPAFEPAFDDTLVDDPFKLDTQPIQFDTPLPGTADLVGPSKKPRTPFGGPRFFDRPGGYFSGAVPEPTTWAMMICGIAAIAYRLRSQRRKILKERARARWRRGLVPPSGGLARRGLG